MNFFRELFAGFLRTRHFGRHFRRLVFLDSLRGTTVLREMPPSLAERLLAASRTDLDTLWTQLRSHPDGLTDDEADSIRERVGPNEVEHEKPLPWWRHLWHCYRAPFSLLLTVLAVVSYVTEDIKATTVISSMVVLATLIRFWQESKSNKAADKLKAMVSNTATALRRDPPRRIELRIAALVPGDVVRLSAGDMIPADCRVVQARDLFVNQSAMTGESLPLEKYAQQRDPVTANPLELDNILFMGTNVVSGSARAVVVTTGNQTYFGALAQRVTSADRTPTQFQAGVNQVAWLLIRVLEEGVIEGRQTFANMLKYIKMTASSNFGNVFSVLVASAFLPFLPMLPIHLLVQNLLYDISQIAIPFDNVDPELLQAPQRWNPAGIGRFMIFFGPISSVFDITTYCVMWFVFHANNVARQTLFQSGWFVVGLLTQTLIVHMIRTPKIPFLQSRASPALLATSAFIIAVGIFIPMGPFASYFKLQALPRAYFPILVTILMGYMTLTQLMKGYYTRRFGWQ